MSSEKQMYIKQTNKQKKKLRLRKEEGDKIRISVVYDEYATNFYKNNITAEVDTNGLNYNGFVTYSGHWLPPCLLNNCKCAC